LASTAWMASEPAYMEDLNSAGPIHLSVFIVGLATAVIIFAVSFIRTVRNLMERTIHNLQKSN